MTNRWHYQSSEIKWKVWVKYSNILSFAASEGKTSIIEFVRIRKLDVFDTSFVRHVSPAFFYC